MEDGIGAKLEARKLFVPLYGTGRSTIDLKLILSKGEGDAVLESARFTDAKTAACFGLEVVDYRSLTIARDPDAAITGSVYTSAIELTLRDGRIDPLRPAGALVLKPSVAGMDERRSTVTATEGKGKAKGDQTGQFAITFRTPFPAFRCRIRRRGVWGWGQAPNPAGATAPEPISAHAGGWGTFRPYPFNIRINVSPEMVSFSSRYCEILSSAARLPDTNAVAAS